MRLQRSGGRRPTHPALIRFLDGDELAFRALHRRHAGGLRAIVVRRDEADDTLQDTWLAACRAGAVVSRRREVLHLADRRIALDLRADTRE